MDFFFLFHNFTDRRFNLTRDLSNLCTQFFLSPLSEELSGTHFKEALWDFPLANLNCQYHYYSCRLGSLRKIKVTRTQELGVQLIWSAPVTTRWTWRTEEWCAPRAGQQIPPCCSEGHMIKLFISGSFHLMFSDHSRPGINETTECKTMDKWGSMVRTKYPSYCNSVWVPHLKRDTNQTVPKGNVIKRDLKPGWKGFYGRYISKKKCSLY